jgi:hypothetical protein
MTAAFRLSFTWEARDLLEELAAQKQDARRVRKVRNALAHIQANPRHPGLQSHKYSSLKGAAGEEVWESYVENNTPSAWRIFWHYGPRDGEITIVTVSSHP